MKISGLVTSKVIGSINKALTELLCTNRWSAYIADDRYNELNKQALNATITYLLAVEAKESGKAVDMTRLPKIILHRVFEKLVLCDMREDYIERILKLGSIKKRKFNRTIEQYIEAQSGREFADFITIDKDCLEIRIFQATTKICTKLELVEIRSKIFEEDYVEAMKELDNILIKYNDLPGFSLLSLDHSNERKFFIRVSALRNRIRWQKRLKTVKCAVLGHNLEVAIISYLMALKQYENEDIATKCFFIGLLHDLAETYTGDMPKPVKDSIPGLREATEYFEMEMIEEHVYTKMPEHTKEALSDVMLEEKGQVKGYKKIIKEADSLSAALECLRNLIAGSREPYFRIIVDEALKKGKAELPDGMLKYPNPYKEFYEAFESMAKCIL